MSDHLTIRIHAQFTGHPSQTYAVGIGELDQSDKLALLRRIWTAPESFNPLITNRDITEAAARSFATLAQGLQFGTRLHPHCASKRSSVDCHPGNSGLFLNNDAMAFKPI